MKSGDVFNGAFDRRFEHKDNVGLEAVGMEPDKALCPDVFADIAFCADNLYSVSEFRAANSVAHGGNRPDAESATGAEHKAGANNKSVFQPEPDNIAAIHGPALAINRA